MKISAGVLFIKNKKILLAHATGQKHWDIPKGQREDSENFNEAAIRECYEEIGFKIDDENDLKDLGVVDYMPQKQLALFLYTGEEYPDENKCVCSSFFFDRWNRKTFEVDDFKYVAFEELESHTTKNMYKTLHRIIEEFSH